MPNKYIQFFDRYKITAFFHRPLIWLLPFFMAGIYWGWRQPENIIFFSWLAVCGCLASIGASFLAKKKVIFWAITSAAGVIFLGSFLMALNLQPPQAPNSLHNFNFTAPIILEGRVLDSQAYPDGLRHRLIVDTTGFIKPGDESGVYTKASGLARINVGGVLHGINIGDYVRFPALPGPIKGYKNPGLSDVEKYWNAQNIWVGAFIKSPWLISSWPSSDNENFIRKLRTKSADFILKNCPEPASGLLASMLIGQRQAVNKDSEEVFRRLGLSHILSVSGLHLGLWYAVCFFVARQLIKLTTSILNGVIALNIAAASLALIPALFYAAVVGSAPPVLRSALMIALATAALVSRRGVDIYNVLALAAWIVLIFEPQKLMTVSFQLSFSATLAMVAIFRARKSPDKVYYNVLFQPISLKLVKAILQKNLKNNMLESKQAIPFIRGLTLASIAGTLGTAPLVIWHFGYLPIIGLLTNLFFTSIISAFSLIPGLISLMLLPFNEALACLVLKFSADSLMLLMPILERLAQWSGPGLLLPAPSLVFIIFYYFALLLLLGRYLKIKARICICIILLTIGFGINHLSREAFSKNLKFTALDVGQGSSIHVSFPDGTQMLVDGGGSFYFDPGEQLVTPYLLHQGISRLDIVALSHPDLDHLKGLVFITDKFNPKQVWSAPWEVSSSTLYETFLQNSRNSIRPSWQEIFGEHFLGPVKVEILWPPPDQKWLEVTKAQFNDLSMVMRIQWGDESFLITGDIEKNTESALVEKYGSKLKSKILMASHHGSRNSLNKDFLKAVSPECVVFSVGRANMFNFPHPETLERTQASGAAIWRTDLHGAAVFEVQNKKRAISLKDTKPCFGGQDILK